MLSPIQQGLTSLGNVPEGTNVQIITENQALVQALANKETESVIVNDKKEAMNAWGLNQDLHINWIKAHNDHEGNKLADMLAKDDAMGLGNGPLHL